MAQRQPKSTPAIAALTAAGVEFAAHAYAHDTAAVAAGLAYGEEAARALGVDPGQVFKTLVIDLGGALGVAILPVLGRLDLKATASVLAKHGGAKKATLADPAAAARATGYVVGGISPLGQRRSLPSVLDSSALARDTIFVSGGRRGLDVELSPVDLILLTHAVTGSICRG